MKIISEVENCPLGKYYYIVDCHARGKVAGHLLKYTPGDAWSEHDYEGEKQREFYSLREMLRYHSSWYTIYQFNNKKEFKEYFNKLIYMKELTA